MGSDDFECGYRPTGDKHVCPDCLEDDFLKEHIKSLVDSTYCDYCGRESEELIAAPLDELIEYIISCVETEYGNPDDEGVPVEGGEYVWPVLDSYDLIGDEIGLDGNQPVIDDIITALSDRQWVEKDYRTADIMLSGWARFVREIKHHRRYFFGLETDEYMGIDVAPWQFLDRLKNEILDVPLTKTIKTDDLLFRARAHDNSKTYSRAAELCTPKAEDAFYSNRMSPAGIPMFYGATDIATAIAEAHHTKPAEPCVTVGVFKPLRDLVVLDLTALPEIPNIFDDQNNYLRATISFLREFVKDLIKPIVRDDKIHVEYVPTQVITEFIRHSLKTEDGTKFDGILYKSSVNPAGTSCVLFVENDECCDKNVAQREWKPYILSLNDTQRSVI